MAATSTDERGERHWILVIHIWTCFRCVDERWLGRNGAWEFPTYSGVAVKKSFIHCETMTEILMDCNSVI